MEQRNANVKSLGTSTELPQFTTTHLQQRSNRNSPEMSFSMPSPVVSSYFDSSGSPLSPEGIFARRHASPKKEAAVTPTSAASPSPTHKSSISVMRKWRSACEKAKKKKSAAQQQQELSSSLTLSDQLKNAARQVIDELSQLQELCEQQQQGISNNTPPWVLSLGHSFITLESTTAPAASSPFANPQQQQHALYFTVAAALTFVMEMCVWMEHDEAHRLIELLRRHRGNGFHLANVVSGGKDAQEQQQQSSIENSSRGGANFCGNGGELGLVLNDGSPTISPADLAMVIAARIAAFAGKSKHFADSYKSQLEIFLGNAPKSTAKAASATTRLTSVQTWADSQCRSIVAATRDGLGSRFAPASSVHFSQQQQLGGSSSGGRSNSNNSNGVSPVNHAVLASPHGGSGGGAFRETGFAPSSSSAAQQQQQQQQQQTLLGPSWSSYSPGKTFPPQQLQPCADTTLFGTSGNDANATGRPTTADESPSLQEFRRDCSFDFFSVFLDASMTNAHDGFSFHSANACNLWFSFPEFEDGCFSAGDTTSCGEASLVPPLNLQQQLRPQAASKDEPEKSDVSWSALLARTAAELCAGQQPTTTTTSAATASSGALPFFVAIELLFGLSPAACRQGLLLWVASSVAKSSALKERREGEKKSSDVVVLGDATNSMNTAKSSKTEDPEEQQQIRKAWSSGGGHRGSQDSDDDDDERLAVCRIRKLLLSVGNCEEEDEKVALELISHTARALDSQQDEGVANIPREAELAALVADARCTAYFTQEEEEEEQPQQHIGADDDSPSATQKTPTTAKNALETRQRSSSFEKQPRTATREKAASPQEQQPHSSSLHEERDREKNRSDDDVADAAGGCVLVKAAVGEENQTEDDENENENEEEQDQAAREQRGGKWAQPVHIDEKHRYVERETPTGEDEYEENSRENRYRSRGRTSQDDDADADADDVDDTGDQETPPRRSNKARDNAADRDAACGCCVVM